MSVPACTECGREFTSDAGLEQHRRDRHATSSHDTKEVKRKVREEWKESERAKAHGAKKRKALFVVAAASLAVLIVSYVVITGTPAPPQTAYNLTGIPSHFVHWHADADVVICGEDTQLPYGPAGSFLGTGRLHTHDYAANVQSFPESDGNGVIHSEGNIVSAPAEHTLGRFMQNIGITFSKTEIMDKKNGDSCGNETGVVTVLLNGKLLGDPEHYLPRDNDPILIAFGPANASAG